MIVYVKDARNNIGHPTVKCSMIRKLIKQNRAKIVKCYSKDIIIVQLLDKVFDKSKTVEAEFRIGIDPGYKHIGFAIFKISNFKITKLLSGELETRTHEVKDNLDSRRMFRNNRRRNRRKNVLRKSGSVKFRHPIWKNRKKHKFQPTHRHLIQTHFNLLYRLFKLIPTDQTKIHIEYNKFDSQKMIDPRINSFWYQRGKQYGFENTKAYVRNRDNYRCQICKTDVSKQINHVHHIQWKSNGGSDKPDNLLLLCPECHNKVHTSNIICPTKSTSVNRYRDSGVLNSCMKHMFQCIESSDIPIQDTQGYITACERRNMKISKTHANDACIIAFCDSLGVQDFTAYTYINSTVTLTGIQYRRHNRSFTQRYEDRKYYIDGFNSNKVIAWNRNRRDGQDKNKICLTELKQKLITLEKLDKVCIIAKPGRRIEKSLTKDYVIRRGDIVKKNDEVHICKGVLNKGKTITLLDVQGTTGVKKCQKILNNSGIIFM